MNIVRSPKLASHFISQQSAIEEGCRAVENKKNITSFKHFPYNSGSNQGYIVSVYNKRKVRLGYLEVE